MIEYFIRSESEQCCAILDTSVRAKSGQTLRHQYGISIAEAQTSFLQNARGEERGEERGETAVFASYRSHVNA